MAAGATIEGRADSFVASGCKFNAYHGAKICFVLFCFVLFCFLSFS